MKTCKLEHCKERRNDTTRCVTYRRIKLPRQSQELRNPWINRAPANSVSVYHSANKSRTRQILIMIEVILWNGFSALLRVLLDSASEANFITQAAYNRTGLKRNNTIGLNGREQNLSYVRDILNRSILVF